jgi:hypothetical protein
LIQPKKLSIGGAKARQISVSISISSSKMEQSILDTNAGKQLF